MILWSWQIGSLLSTCLVRTATGGWWARDARQAADDEIKVASLVALRNVRSDNTRQALLIALTISFPGRGLDGLSRCHSFLETMSHPHLPPSPRVDAASPLGMVLQSGQAAECDAGRLGGVLMGFTSKMASRIQNSLVMRIEEVEFGRGRQLI